MTSSSTLIPADSWVSTSWDNYLQISADAAYRNTKTYYHNGQMRLEAMAALGNPHSRDHFIVIHAVGLFAALRGLDLDGHDNCSYRKTGITEIQPDASFYVGTNADRIPWDATIIDLDIYPAPDLVIEVAYSSLADDTGEKRRIYEALGIEEYWIIDVQNCQILAFAMPADRSLTTAGQASLEITTSQVLPNLKISLLEAALQRSRQTNHGKVSAWLMAKFQT